MIRSIAGLLLFLLSTLSALSQTNEYIDSLIRSPDTLKGTTKIDMVNAIGWKLSSNDPERSIEYSKKAIRLSVKKNYKRGMADANHNIGSVYFSKGKYDLSLKYYLKSLKIKENIADTLEIRENYDDKSAIATSINNIGGMYYYFNDYDTALKYFYRALEIYIEENDKEGMAMAYGNRRYVWY